MQTSPPPDELLFALMTRSILICQPEEFPLTTSIPSEKTPVCQQDRASTNSEIFSKAQEHQEEPMPSEPTADHHPVNETPVHPVEPVLGTSSESRWLQDTNQHQDITDILGMTAYEGYVRTPIQTLYGLYVKQPKHFLPLAEEAKILAEEIHQEKQAEQWAGIPHKKLLNQSFLDQLNSLQILEQLAPLQLAKEHLPSDIIDILEDLGR